jgi:DNA-binding response OmpR family regulator
MKIAKTILIVEDEVPLLNVLRDKLTHEGFAILTAEDGTEGLELALTKHPDLILLDINLPRMDGLTVLKHINADPWGAKSKVIMLTNLNDYQSVAAALALGSKDFLVKSDWKIEELVKIVNESLKTSFV